MKDELELEIAEEPEPTAGQVAETGAGQELKPKAGQESKQSKPKADQESKPKVGQAGESKAGQAGEPKVNQAGEPKADQAEEPVVEPAVEPVVEPVKDYDELFDRYQRSLAEFDNFRKRTLKEKAASYDTGVSYAIEKLLPTLDNFARALSSAEDKQDPFYKGVEMIARQLDNYLSELGAEGIESSGAAFDHNLHYAVAHVEDENYGQNEIIEELQKGYTYKGRVIRASMVRVAN